MATELESTIQAGHHVVQFYERAENLALAVASFLGAGLVDGGAALVVATAEHRAAFEGVMAAAGIDIVALAAEGRYVGVDAAELLAAFTVDSEPDPSRFARRVGDLVAETAVGRPLRIYGEMVGLLWDAGNVAGAIAVEAMWNDLAGHHAFALFCGYPMQSVEGMPGGHDEICRHHSDVIPEATEPALSADGASRTFEPTRFAAPAARRFVTSVLEMWGDDALVDNAALVVSELATNAVLHVGERFEVSVSRQHDTVRIAVSDPSPAGPKVRRDKANRGTNGRGMHLIAAASREWGTDTHPDGKTVWADLDASARLGSN